MLHSVFERADKLDGEKEGEDGDDDCDDEDMLYVLSHFNRVSLFCDSMDCSPPGFPVHGVLQARVLEQVAMPSSMGIFPTQGLITHLLHSCFGKWDVYQ